MDLTRELQEQLDKINSSLQLDVTIDATPLARPGFYYKSAFYNKPGRGFRSEYISRNNKFSVVLFEKNDQLIYQYCFARGAFDNTKRLAEVIDLWVVKQQDIGEIKKSYDELELFQDVKLKNSNPAIDKAWTKVKNLFFNDTRYWKNAEWKDRYNQMLEAAKSHPAFQKFISLYKPSLVTV